LINDSFILFSPLSVIIFALIIKITYTPNQFFQFLIFSKFHLLLNILHHKKYFLNFILILRDRSICFKYSEFINDSFMFSNPSLLIWLSLIIKYYLHLKIMVSILDFFKISFNMIHCLSDILFSRFLFILVYEIDQFFLNILNSLMSPSCFLILFRICYCLSLKNIIYIPN
jgi:hypothetical protein